MQLCAITDRKGATTPLLTLVERWSTGGVDFIQLREKDLSPAALQSLTREVLARINRRGTKLLVNVSSSESAALALEAGADGVHLAGTPLPGAASSVRKAFRSTSPIMSVPCHSLADIDVACGERVDLILFSPVFEKLSAGFSHPAQGLESLRLACAAARGTPVLALGGVAIGNASGCIAAGAAGIAGIRLFAGDDWRRLQGQTEPMEPYIVK
jgi:thiamine-phosphate pyrophosphorylase